MNPPDPQEDDIDRFEPDDEPEYDGDDEIDDSGYPISRTNPFGERD